MSSVPFQILALQELVSYTQNFALLREPDSWEKAGDVDIVVGEPDKFAKLLQQLGYIRLGELNKYIRYESSTKQWLHLDVQPKIYFGSIETPRDFITKLLKAVYVSENDIPRLNPVDEAVLTLLHFVLEKGRFNQKYFQNLSHIDTSLIHQRSEVFLFLPEPLEKYWQWLMGMQEGTLSEKAVIMEVKDSFEVSSTRNLSIVRIFRRVKTFFRGSGGIAFLGPDGAGKSALTHLIVQLKWPAIRLQYMGPDQEDEMRQIFFAAMRVAERIRDEYSKKSLIGILARVTWQIINYLDLLERSWRHIWFLGSNGVVVFDRYACDVYIRKPRLWSEFFFLKMFPRPCFAVLCVGDPGLIHQRKSELLPDEIQAMIDLYRKKLSEYNIPHIEIDTTSSKLEDSLLQVVRYLIDNNWFRN